ncbi:hypothetical protein [Shimia sp. FJ5]|uniref:hypothetical protein n=1 Tax=Shimia sp. FJ5 TaxID=3079054 RepID=UPI00293DB6AB|nr:hypothetical protein [Shimia sp. FJ5]MDV4145829.1 hypothetical protein [Shimia sp. FJ5]
MDANELSIEWSTECADTIKKILTGGGDLEIPIWARIEAVFEEITEGMIADHEDISLIGMEVIVERLSYPPESRKMHALHVV